MKKIQYILFALAIVLPFGVSAATFSVVPNVATIKPGNTIVSSVYVNPGAGETLYAAKVSILFPASTVELISYTPVSGGSILAHIGTKTNKTAGTIIDNVAFNPGITVPTKVATIVFKAGKKDGTANITFSSDSKLFNKTTVNKYVASSGASFTIKTPAPKPPKTTPVFKTPAKKITKTTSTKKSAVSSIQIVKGTSATTSVATTTATTTDATATSTDNGQGATVSESTKDGGGFFTTKTISFAVVFILLIIGWLFYFKRKKA